jgi:NADPH2:quinone reductase
MPDPQPAAGEVRIRIAASGINPGDIKKRKNEFAFGMAYPRVIPHSDGAGVVDSVGEGVSSEWIGAAVWCFGAQSYRPFGTAAEFTVLPVNQIARLPEGVPMEQGACLGIPGITAHRAVHIAGPVIGRTVLVQGAAGAVGVCAVQLARRSGAHVIGTVRSSSAESMALQAGAHAVTRNDSDVVAHVRALMPGGIDHIVEVAFDENVEADLEILRTGGSIATYAANRERPDIPFWPMV